MLMVNVTICEQNRGVAQSGNLKRPASSIEGAGGRGRGIESSPGDGATSGGSPQTQVLSMMMMMIMMMMHTQVDLVPHTDSRY
jgi:hypothetical protein